MGDNYLCPPCGTPELTFTGLKHNPLILTNSFLLDKQEQNHDNKDSPKQKDK